MNKIVLLLVIFIVSNTTSKSNRSFDNYVIDSTTIKYDNYYSVLYSISNFEYLNNYRMKLNFMFQEDECLNCIKNSKNEFHRDSNSYQVIATSEREIFDYQYWNNGSPKIKNILTIKNKQLHLKRVEYDSLKALLKTNSFIYVKDTALIEYEQKISGWFRIK